MVLAELFGPWTFAGIVAPCIVMAIALLVAPHRKVGLKLGDFQATVEDVKQEVAAVKTIAESTEHAVNNRPDHETTVSQDVRQIRDTVAHLVVAVADTDKTVQRMETTQAMHGARLIEVGRNAADAKELAKAAATAAAELTTRDDKEHAR